MRFQWSIQCLAILAAISPSSATTSETAGLPLVYASTLPQIADGQFGGGSVRTTFVLFNNGDRATSVTLAIRDDEGGPLTVTIPELGTSDSFEFTLDQGEIRFLQTDASGEARAGSAQVLSDIRIGVSAIFTIRDRAGNFLTESGVGVSNRLTELQLPVDASEDLNTGLAIRNLDPDDPVVLTLTLRDSEGVQAGPAAAMMIPPAGHRAQFVAGDLFPGLGSFRGKLEVTATGPIAALALRQKASPLSFTTLPVVDAESTRTEFALPQVPANQLANTTFILFNLDSTQSANVTLRVTGIEGEPFPVQLSDGQEGSQLEILLPPDGTRFLTTLGVGETGGGAARISSDLPIGVAGILTLEDGSGNLFAETGIGDSTGVSKATIPVGEGEFNTGIALFNNNDATILVSARFTDDSGVADDEPGSLDFEAIAPVELPPFGRFSVFVQEFGVDLDGRKGMLAVSTTLPVSALALRQNNEPLAFTSFPVADGFAATVSDSGRALPPQGRLLDLTTDSVVDWEISSGFELSGGVLLPGPFDHVVSVSAVRSGDGRFFAGSVAENPSRFRFILPAGVYTILVQYLVGPDFFFPARSDPAPTSRRSFFDGKLLESGLVPFPLAPGAGGSHVTAGFETPGVLVEGDSLRNLRAPGLTRSAVTGNVTALERLPPEFTALPLLLQFLPTNGAVATGLANLREDGSFDIQLPEGTYRLLMAASEIENTPVATIGIPTIRPVQIAALDLGELAVGGPSTIANPTVPELVRVSGQVSFPYSQRLPLQTIVTASGSTGDPTFFGASAGFAASDGTYRMSLVRNRGYRFSVLVPIESPEGYLSLPQPLDAAVEAFSEDTTRDFSDFPSLPETVTVTGRVTGPTGPVKGAVVTVVANGLTGAPELSFTASATTDEEGRYTLPALSAAGYRASLSLGAVSTVVVPIPQR